MQYLLFRHTLAKQNLSCLKELEINQPVLVILDRGYPSLELIDFLETNRINYLIRLSCNDYIKERVHMVSSDEVVCLKHTYARLEKIHKKQPQRYEHMKEKKETFTRMIKKQLPSGQELTFITNLPDNFTSQQIQNLYYQRWEIEKKYHTLKNKMKLESVTGKSSIYVYQDFYAQILVYNMMQDIRRNADYEAKQKGYQKGNKYCMHTNENIAIGLFKESMIKIILEKNAIKKEFLLLKLQIEMEEHVLPKRKLLGYKHKRRKNISNKYKNNQKNSF